MSLKDKLQIILITYNRAKHVQNMLGILLADNSPAKDINILVLDNNSTDNTLKTVKSFQDRYPNVSYHKNPYNLGIGGNIARAMEMANQEYVWILGDDDELHFEAWPDLEEAIAQNKEIIVAARYAIPDGYEKSPIHMIWQMTFISACIFKTSIFSDTTMTNVINNIYTLFPHLVPVVEYINDGKADKMYALPHALVSNGMKPETDCSYIRGYQNEKLYLKQRSMSWIVGFVDVMIELKNKKMLHKLLPAIHPSWGSFYNHMYINYVTRHNWLPVFEAIRAIPLRRKIEFLFYISIPIKIYRRDNKYLYLRIWRFKTKIWKIRNKK